MKFSRPHPRTQVPRRVRTGNLLAGTKLDVRSRLSVVSEPLLVLLLLAGLASWSLRVPPTPQHQAREVETRADLRIDDIQVVDRTHDQVTIRWSTNLESDTKVRVGQTRDYTRIVENPAQRRELDHSIVIHGLKSNTVYHYQIVAGDAEDPAAEITSDDKRFVTRTDCSRPDLTPAVCKRPVWSRHRHPRYLCGTPSSNVLYHRSPLPLNPASKKRFAAARTTGQDFHRRRMFLDRWVAEFEEAARPLPEGITQDEWTVRDEIEYLKSLYYVNQRRALEKLDLCMRRMEQADTTL